MTQNKKRTRPIDAKKSCYSQFDFLWTHLIWDFVGDAKDLFAIRKTMRSTRYVKGKHFSKEFPIGPYSYDQFLNVIKMPDVSIMVYVDETSSKNIPVSWDRRAENILAFTRLRTESTVSRNHAQESCIGFHSYISNVAISYRDKPQRMICVTNTTKHHPCDLHISFSPDYYHGEFIHLGKFLVFHSTVVLDVVKPMNGKLTERVVVNVDADASHQRNFNLVVNCEKVGMYLDTNATKLTINGFGMNVRGWNIKEMTLSCSFPIPFILPLGDYPNLEHVHFVHCFIHTKWNINALPLPSHIRISQTNQRCSECINLVCVLV